MMKFITPRLGNSSAIVVSALTLTPGSEIDLGPADFKFKSPGIIVSDDERGIDYYSTDLLEDGDSSEHSFCKLVEPPEEPRWGKVQDKLFRNLAVKEALDKLSESDAKILEELSALRRRVEELDNPEAALRERLRAKRVRNLVKSLNEYFIVYNGGES